MVEFLVDNNSGIAGKKFKLILNVPFQSCFFTTFLTKFYKQAFTSRFVLF